MKERPIIFSGEMVRAILEGRKTMTRRIVKASTRDDWNACPYGVIGDRLWVRETWGDVTLAFQSHENDEPEVIAFRADEGVYNAHSMMRLEKMSDSGIVAPKWKPSIFMPRWASRITLEVVSVRAERLQEISEEDAEAEGCKGDHRADRDLDAAQEFRLLWDSINGKRASWESNPWVWVIEFKRVM